MDDEKLKKIIEDVKSAAIEYEVPETTLRRKIASFNDVPTNNGLKDKPAQVKKGKLLYK